MATEKMSGDPIASGVAQGLLCFLSSASVTPPRDAEAVSAEPGAEIERFREQVSALVDDLEEAAARLSEQPGTPGADILRTHILVLEGENFRSRVEDSIRQTRSAAEAAVEAAVKDIVAVFESSGNPVLAERAPDLKDLALQLRQRLAGTGASVLADLAQEASECVLAVRELLPSLVLEAHARGVRGFVVDRGTSLSHGAILARSFGVPVLRVPRLDTLWSREGSQVLVDAVRGELLIEPSPAETRARLPTARRRGAAAPSPSPLARVWLNIVDPEELVGFEWGGLEGVGLYRTEMLFMGERRGLPSEEEQIEAYRKLFSSCGRRPATVRTLDIGGDKTLPYFSLGPQANPALGLRAHRIYRFHPEILLTQVRAILRAASGFGGLRLLFPMIECVEEWRFVQRLVDRAVASLRDDGLPFQRGFERGVLVETPSAAWSFRRLLDLADFASVGTNDLVQYLFAVDRTNANVLRTYGPEHPIVLQILRDLARAATRAGKSLSLCGEIGSDEGFLPLVIGLGITDVSVAVNRAEAVSARLSTLKLRECRRLANACLDAETVDEVSALLGRPAGGVRAPGASIGSGVEEVDPICGMAVHTEGNPLNVQRNGDRYFFCSRACLDTFLRRPK